MWLPARKHSETRIVLFPTVMQQYHDERGVTTEDCPLGELDMGGGWRQSWLDTRVSGTWLAIDLRTRVHGEDVQYAIANLADLETSRVVTCPACGSSNYRVTTWSQAHRQLNSGVYLVTYYVQCAECHHLYGQRLDLNNAAHDITFEQSQPPSPGQ